MNKVLAIHKDNDVYAIAIQTEIGIDDSKNTTDEEDELAWTPIYENICDLSFIIDYFKLNSHVKNCGWYAVENYDNQFYLSKYNEEIEEIDNIEDVREDTKHFWSEIVYDITLNEMLETLMAEMKEPLTKKLDNLLDELDEIKKDDEVKMFDYGDECISIEKKDEDDESIKKVPTGETQFFG